MKHLVNPTTKTKISHFQQGDVQPNAIDIRMDRVFQLDSGLFKLSDTEKVHRSRTEIFPDAEGFFYLKKDCCYQVIMEQSINVPAGEAGLMVIRSTLGRNGILMSSSLYDSGYAGPMEHMLHITTGDAMIKKGTRIAQYLCFDAETAHLYNGSYGFGKTEV